MIALAATFSILAVAAQVPAKVDSMRVLASHGSDSALVEGVQRSPVDARAAWRRLLTAGGRGDSAAVAALDAAERLAGAIAIAWRDSFPLRQVARFRSLSPTDRQATIAADSVRRAGDDAEVTEGVGVAMPLWRESLRRFEVLADTARFARALNEIGQGFITAQEYDSAELYLARSRDLAERIRDYYRLGMALENLGSLSGLRGDLQRAAELYGRASSILQLIGDVEGLATIQGNLGVVARKQGDLAGARRAYEAALAANRSAGSADAADAAASNLLNLGNLASNAGEYEEAADRYGEALAIRRSLGNTLGAALVLYNMGLFASQRGDDLSAIRTLIEAVEMVRRVGGGHFEPSLPLARARARMGDLQGARAELARAEAFANRRGGAGRAGALAQLALGRAEVAVAFNRLAEAERQFTRAQRLVDGAPNASVRSIVWLQAQYGLADVLLQSRSYRRAEVVIEQLRGKLFSKDVTGRALTRVMSGQAAWGLGDTAAAYRAFAQAIDTLRALGQPIEEAQALATLGHLEARSGRTLVAESLYQAGLSRLGMRRAPSVAWQLHAGLAGALRHRGALADAAGELQGAIAQIEQVSGGLPLEEQRSAFRADKWDAYVELALVERARGRMEAAFEASERLRARQMLDLLARGRVPDADTNSGNLRSREQDLRRRIAELARQTEPPRDNAGGGLRDPAAAGASSAVSEALARAQQAYGALLLEMREANPAYAALVHGEVASAREVMGALAPDEAVLEYLVGDSTTVVFIVTRDTVEALDLKVNHRTLAAQVDFARSTLTSPTTGATRPAWRPSLRRLYRELVAPVETSGLLAGKRRLLIAPHAELHYLPFAALLVPGPPERLLIERYVLEYVPSASVWLRLRERPQRTAASGVLALAPRTAALPGSQAEVAAIGRIYGDRARVLTRVGATEGAFRMLAPEQGIIHLATFGVLNKHNPLFSYVQLGAGSGEDGRLEVHEVFGLTLNARLLVLSACQTGVAAGVLADVPPGDDWVGLVNAFLYAGASNVMATLWPVADVSTARLMERFYREFAAGQTEVEALARAQRAAARSSATAHPFFWAGFTMVRGR